MRLAFDLDILGFRQLAADKSQGAARHLQRRLAGALGLLAVGIFADGLAGTGWNGIGADNYLGVPTQGITGLLASANIQPDWPRQMQAQLVGLAALALCGFFVAWIFLAPPALLIRLLSRTTDRSGTGRHRAALSPQPSPVAEGVYASQTQDATETSSPHVAVEEAQVNRDTAESVLPGDSSALEHETGPYGNVAHEPQVSG